MLELIALNLLNSIVLIILCFIVFYSYKNREKIRAWLVNGAFEDSFSDFSEELENLTPEQREEYEKQLQEAQEQQMQAMKDLFKGALIEALNSAEAQDVIVNIVSASLEEIFKTIGEQAQTATGQGELPISQDQMPPIPMAMMGLDLQKILTDENFDVGKLIALFLAQRFMSGGGLGSGSSSPPAGSGGGGW